MSKLIVNERILNILKSGKYNFCSMNLLNIEEDKELYSKFDDLCVETIDCGECLKEFISTVLVNIQEEEENEEEKDEKT